MNALYPLLCSDNLAADRDFYTTLFGMRVVFEADWYVQLQSEANPGLQIAFVAREHHSIPEADQCRPAGVIVTIELDDVDTIAQRARDLDLPMVQELRNEDWGQRHFMTRDPSGLVVDVVRMIPPTEEFEDDYVG